MPAEKDKTYCSGGRVTVVSRGQTAFFSPPNIRKKAVWPRETSAQTAFFSFCVGAAKKKGLVDLQYIFCAAGSTTFGDR